MITNDLEKAVQALVHNEIIAVPTETVYGLAGNAYNETALFKIFELKKRPLYNPLIVHIKSVSFLQQVAADIPEIAIKLAEAFWPGSLTLILNKKPHIPDMVTAGKDTVAIRVPNHPLTLELLNLLDFPLAAPSANPFGSISPTSAQHVYNYFEDELGIILDGGFCEKGIESTIIGFENNKPILYRHGSVVLEEIESLVGKVIVQTKNDSSPTAPGMLSSHYAPKTPTYFTNDVSGLIADFSDKKIGLLLYKNEITGENILHQEILSKKGDLKEASKNLYAALHRLDQSKPEVIIAERLPESGLGKSINDRLQRAAVRF